MRVQLYVLAALMSIPSVASAQADTVVIRVTSPRGAEVAFNGVITFRDGKTERRLDGVVTPFELRLPAQDIDARFSAADGGALSGDLVTYRDGKQRGQAAGTNLRGEVKLHYEPGVSYGYGGRPARGLRLTP